MELLSDADVFGDSQGLLSDDEVFGTPEPTQKPETFEPIPEAGPVRPESQKPVSKGITEPVPEQDFQRVLDDPQATPFQKQLATHQLRQQPVTSQRDAPPIPMPEEPKAPDPFKGESFGDLATRRGQQFTRGATEVVASIPEAAAISDASFDAAVISQAPDRIKRSAESAQRLQETLKRPDLSEIDRQTYQDRLNKDVEAVKNWFEVSQEGVVPAENRPTFKTGDTIREAVTDTVGAPDPRDQSLWASVSEGGGNMVGFVVGSLLTGPVAPFTGAALGSSLNSSALYKEAKQSGADEETALKAARLGAVIGASEIVPIGRAFKMMPIPPSVRDQFEKAFTRAVSEVVQSAGEEGAQEALAGIANNLVASGLYDPDRGWSDDITEQALVGAILGGGMGTVSAGIDYAQTPSQVSTNPPPGSPEPVTPLDVADLGDPPNVTTPEVQPQDSAVSPVESVTPSENLPEEAMPGFDPDTGEEVQGVFNPNTNQWRPMEEGERPPGAPTRADLEDLLNDERSADEIRAEREANKADNEANNAIEAPVIDVPATDVETAAAQVETPTPAQAEAGNYKKGHLKYQGHDIAIETAKGQERTGTDPDGKPWSVRMPANYGYIKRTEGADGDQVDVYLGPVESDQVYVVDQIDAETGKFDEHKVMMGFPDAETALATYDAAFSDGRGPQRRASVTPMSQQEFKTWLKDGNQKQPLAKAAPVGDAAQGPAAVVPASVPAPPSPDDIRKVRRFVTNRKDPLNTKKMARVTGLDESQVTQALQRLVNERSVRINNKGGFARMPKTGPLDVMQSIAAMGGIRDDEGHSLGDLQKFVPGFGQVIRAKGRSLDDVGERLWQQGYFGDPSIAASPTEAETLDLLDRAGRGEAIFSVYDTAEVERRQAEQALIEQQEQEETAREDIRAAAKAVDAKLSQEEEDAALALVGEGYESDDAVDFVMERSALREVENYDTRDDGQDFDIPFPPPATDTGRTVAAGQESAPESVETEEPDTGRAEERPTAGDQPGPDQQTEETDQGEQVLVPGVAAVSQREKLESQMNKPMQGGNAPADGLFSSERDQSDMFGGGADLTRKTAAELNPALFGPPQGDQAQYAVLNSTKEGRRNLGEPLSGDINWLQSEGLASPEGRGKRASLRLTEKGDQLLAKLSRNLGYSESNQTPEPRETASVRKMRKAAQADLPPGHWLGGMAYYRESGMYHLGVERFARAGGVEVGLGSGKTPEEAVRVGVKRLVDDFGPASTTFDDQSVQRASDAEDAKALARAKNSQPEPAESKPDQETADDFDSVFDSALNEQFGEDQKKPSTPTASWVIRDKTTGETVMETFDKKKVDALNTEKYEAVPVQEHLAGLNKKAPSAKKSAKSAVKNTVMGLDEVSKGLGALFGTDDPSRLGSGPNFDEETYQKALPYFRAGAAHFAEAGADIKAVVSALVKYLAERANMSRDAIAAMRPYIKRYVEDVEAGKETIDAVDSSDSVERDSGDAEPADAVGDADVSPATGEDGGDAGQGRGSSDERVGVQPPGRSLFDDGAPVVGEGSDSQLRSGEPDLFGRPADSDNAKGSRDRSEPGLEPDRTPAEAVREKSKHAPAVKDRRSAQEKADTVPVKPADRANLDDTLPLLMDTQRDDVHKAEVRFQKHHGILYTNGTGTGKTYVGGGIVKRFVRQGKKNIVIIAPSKGILNQWKQMMADLGIDVSLLENTQDAGKGVVMTTYANFGENRHLVDRDWDLVVADEAHSLSQNAAGEQTKPLETLRAITNNPRGLWHKARMIERDLVDEVEKLAKEIKLNRTSDDERNWQANTSLEKKRDQKHNELIEKIKEHVATFEKQPRPKTVFLSATPFAYDKSIDYAEGYLFEYPKVENQGGYNTGDGQQQFMMQHFGYRMRYDKLTRPEADVQSEHMERQFHEWLKEQGALSARRLEVDPDYDRQFALVNDGIGNEIDRILKILSENPRYRPLYEAATKKFDYLSRRRLLEALKAKHAVPIIQKSLDMGRKVVVFHDYNEGGGFNPFSFDTKSEQTATYFDDDMNTVEFSLGEAAQEFYREVPEAKEMNFSSIPSPIATLTKAFPDALLYNGTVTPKNRNEHQKLFNDDDSGRDLIVVQADAGSAGLSLHDTTGRHQRLLLNLGMPQKPTTALQQEGRIYRVGQVTDAIIRYLNTGTSWERSSFASTIASRSGTAENLALGNESRAIKQSFIDAFLETDTYEPGPNDGKGGKERDRATNAEITEFDKAITYYYAQGKKRGKRSQREGVDYYATPEPLGLKMVEWANIKPGDKVLEPSAGHGAIARFFPTYAASTIVEPSLELSSKASLVAGGARQITSTFEDLHITNKYDAIVMNPPFGSGGSMAIKHLEKATKHLRNGGRVVALIPTGPAADKKFDKFYEGSDNIYIIADMQMPTVVFERAGTKVMTRVVILEKQTDKESVQDLPTTSNRSYSSAESIQDLFDRIRDAEVKPRTEPKTVDVDIADEGNVTVGGIEFALSDGRTIDDIQYKHAKPKSKLGRAEFAQVAQFAESLNGVYMGGGPNTFSFESGEERGKFLEGLQKGEHTKIKGPASEAGLFIEEDGYHEKEDRPTYVVKLGERVDREHYNHLNMLAKQKGGYYSRFNRGRAVAGFQFKSDEDRKAFIEAATKDKFRAGGSPFPDTWTRTPLSGDTSTVNSPSNVQNRKRVQARLNDAVRSMLGDKAPGITVVDGIEHKGASMRGVFTGSGRIYVSLDHVGIMGTARHELIHFMKTSGMLSGENWKILEGKASDWRKKYDIDRMYAGYGLTEQELNEEAIAEAFGDPDLKPKGRLATAMNRIRRFLEALKNLVSGKAFKSAMGVFEDIEGGLVGAGDVTPGRQAFAAAWHGSPHDFDKFTTGAIGTGEGAQAYGWGLYFAGKKEVADHYRKTLSGRIDIQPVAIDGEKYTPPSPAHQRAAAIVAKDGRSGALGVLRGLRSDGMLTEATERAYQEVLDLTKGKNVTTLSAGRLYEVEIPDDGEYLLWDKPLSEQPEKVREAVRAAFANRKLGDEWYYNYLDRSGSEVYNLIAKGRDGSFATPAWRAGSRPSTQQARAASEALAEAGIPGIKYLDGTSRKDGDGSYNYVIFDENLVQVKEKFAVGRDITETAAFKEWFGDSKVVDEDGKPLVVYHGTGRKFDAFDPNAKAATEGGMVLESAGVRPFFFTSREDVAMDFAGGDPDYVKPVYLSVKNPLIINADGMGWHDFDGQIIEAAKGRKYDGVILRNLEDSMFGDMENSISDVFVAFSPEQIKSIHNRGTFDPNDARMMFAVGRDPTDRQGALNDDPVATLPDSAATDRKRGPRNRPKQDGVMGAAFHAPSEAVWDFMQQDNVSLMDRVKQTASQALTAFRYHIQDKYIDLRNTQDAIKRARGRVDESTDAYMAEELYHGKTGFKLREFQEKTVEPLIQRIGELGLSLEDVEAYLYARHAKERNARIAEINPDLEHGSGMSDAEADAIMARETPDLKEIARQIDSIIRETMRVRVDAGLLSEQEAKQWQDAYKHYVPLRGFQELADDQGVFGGNNTGKGFDVRGKESKQALGRTSKAADILANILTAHEEAIVRGEKNRVGQALLKLAQQNPNKDLWEINKVESKRRMNRKTGMVETAVDPTYTLRDNVLAVKVDGKVKHITIHHKRLASAMKNVGADTGNAFVRLLQGVNRYLAFINTSANAEFIISNMFRDLQTAAVNMQQYDIDSLTWKTMKDVPKALLGAGMALRGKDGGEWAGHFRDFAEQGGKTEFFGLEDTTAKKKKIDRLLKNIDPSKPRQMLNALVALEKVIQDVNGAVENAVRLSAYVNATKAGVSKNLAASMAKNLTVNFNRKGSHGPTLGAAYLFFNASIQGTVLMLHALKHPRVQKFVAGIVIANALLEIMNGMISPEDDDGEKKYDKISDYDRTHNLIVMNPFAGDTDDDIIALKIPMPYGYLVFANIGLAIGRAVRAGMGEGPSEYSPMKDAAEIIGLAMESFNPIGGEADILRTLTPTLAKPTLELKSNEAFHGGPIMPEQIPFGAPKPEHQRFFRSVSPVSKAITEELFDATGGSQLDPAVIDISPEAIDHYVEFLTGATGAFFNRVVKYGFNTATGEDTEWKDVPFSRKVVLGNNSYWKQRRYYDIRTAHSIAKKEFQEARKDGNAAAYRKEHRAELMIDFKAADRALKSLRKRRDRIEESDLSDKKERLEQIEEKMDLIYARTINRYTRAKNP